jgi:hypothetical protein
LQIIWRTTLSAIWRTLPASTDAFFSTGGLQAGLVCSRSIARSNSAFCEEPQNADDAERAIMQSDSARVAL